MSVTEHCVCMHTNVTACFLTHSPDLNHKVSNRPVFEVRQRIPKFVLFLKIPMSSTDFSG
jgi:hypothetical protein